MARIEREKYMHADNQATLHNIHFETKGLPWVADDFLIAGSRQKRQRKLFQDRMITQRIKSKTKSRTTTPEELPAWARELATNSRRVN